MLKISKLHVELKDSQQKILRGVNLEIAPGQVHFLHGSNGSGKSTLAASLAGQPDLAVTSGAVYLDNVDLLGLGVTERARSGLFVAQQYPVEIPGVSLSEYLRLVYEAHHEKLPVFKFRQLLNERAALINYPPKLLERNLNEGFSGGEKKKTEILQLALILPKYAILDETDSGLDKQAILEVFTGIKTILTQLAPRMGLVVITHYDHVSQILTPSHTHELIAGRL